MLSQSTSRPSGLSLPALIMRGWLMPACLGLALLIRISIVLIAWAGVEPTGGDTRFYLMVAHDISRLVSFSAPPTIAVTSIGPVYPLLLYPMVHLLPDPLALPAIRLTQAVLDTVTVWLVYRIALHLFGQRVALVALVMQALDLRYAFQSGNIITETVFITLFTAAMLAYLIAGSRLERRWYIAAGVLLGMSILTRPVPLLFPAVLLVHAWLHPADRRRALTGVGLLMVVTALALTPWIVRNAYIKGELIPVSDTGFNHFWRAAREDGREITSSPTLTEATRQDIGAAEGEPGFTEAGLAEAGMRYVLAAPAQFAARIARSTIAAYAQPYGTNILLPPTAGSAKQTVLSFLRGEAPLEEVLNLPGLWRRVLMYLWHYWGLAGGLAGMVLAWREGWRRSFPLVGWIVYGTAVSAVLLIEPRYLFPLMFAFTVFAGRMTVAIWDRVHSARGRNKTSILPSETDTV